MNREPRPFRRLALTATLGAAAGVGLGVLGMKAAAHLRGGDAPASYPDAGSREAFEKTVAFGPVPGTWELKEEDNVRKRLLEDDPKSPSFLRCTFMGEPKPPKSYDRSMVGRWMTGESELFFANYRPAGPARREEMDGHGVVAVTWGRTDGMCCSSRVIFMDHGSGEVVAWEDHAWNGTKLRSARLTARIEFSSRPAAKPVRPAVVRTFADFVKGSPIPLYEPSRLPAGYERVNYGLTEYRDALHPSDPVVPLYYVRYGDGIAHLDVMMARPEDMRRLVEFARNYQGSTGPGTCPATADVFEDLQADAGAILIRRRADKCRTVLQREDLKGVSVALVGFNEIPGDLYVETMKSLVHVSGSKAE